MSLWVQIYAECRNHPFLSVIMLLKNAKNVLGAKNNKFDVYIGVH